MKTRLRFEKFKITIKKYYQLKGYTAKWPTEELPDKGRTNE